MEYECEKCGKHIDEATDEKGAQSVKMTGFCIDCRKELEFQPS